MGVVIICLASYFANSSTNGIFVIMNNIGALLGIPMAAPTMLAIFIRRAPWWSAIFSASCALCVSAYSLMLDKIWDEPMLFHVKVFTILGVGCVSFLLTIPFWSTSSQAYRDKVTAFFKRMHTPVDFEKEVGQANDSTQLRIVGIFAVIIGVLIHLLCFVPNTMADRLGIVFVGMTLLGIGTLMVMVGKKLDRQNQAMLNREANDNDAVSDSSHA
jgi:branched-subunit amino acid permease